MDLYGQNIEKEFGRFVNTLECAQFDKLDKHMKAMFPDYKGDSMDAPNYYLPTEFETDKFDESRGNVANDDHNAGCSSTDSDEIPSKKQRFSRECESCRYTIFSRPQRSNSVNQPETNSQCLDLPTNLLTMKTKKIDADRAYQQGMEEYIVKLRKDFENLQTQNDVLRVQFDNVKEESKEKIEKLEKEKAEIHEKYEAEKQSAKKVLQLMASHDQKFVELEKKIRDVEVRADTEKNILKTRYKKIVDNVKDEAKKNAAKCNGCGELNRELYCRFECVELW